VARILRGRRRTSNGRSRFPTGMTNKEEQAKAKEKADSRRGGEENAFVDEKGKCGDSSLRSE